MKKKIIIVLISIIVLGGVFAGGYFFANSKKAKDNPVPEEKVEEKAEEIFDKEVTDNNYITTMKKVSETVFYRTIKDESKSFEEIDNISKLQIIDHLSGKSFDKVTTKELNGILHKYFGNNQSVKFENIKCEVVDHKDPEEAYYYIYDSKEGRYIVNPKHPGHGGGAPSAFSFLSEYYDYSFKALTNEKNDKYVLEVKMMFYDNQNVGDIGPSEIKGAYKSYKDLEDGKFLDTIEGNKEYETIDEEGVPHYDLDKVYKNNLDKLDTYVFEFEKENDNLIFTKYYKKA